MKIILIIILLTIFISGCALPEGVREVEDCRQCNTGEFCKTDRYNGYTAKIVVCIKYGDDHEVGNES